MDMLWKRGDEALEERLRVEARRERRAAPAGLKAKVLARLEAPCAEAGREAEPALARSPERSGEHSLEHARERLLEQNGELTRRIQRERPRVALTAAAAAALLTAVWLFDPFGFLSEDRVGPIGNGNPLAIQAYAEQASAAVAKTSLHETVEGPLLRELRALGGDATRAATGLARDLPGPLGALFRR